ncbi:MAG TPA: hypothetical protein ENJ34_00350 [Epsilonproteobacteria bacterium]|nr:hypothetical protein [Campylobacterota bacterium]
MLRTVSLLMLMGVSLWASQIESNVDDLFYEKSVKEAPNAKPVWGRDTDSALGRYNLYPKKLDIKMLARAHGHLCDGLVLAYVELSHTLPKLFSDGVIDRTDIRVVAKNSPCLVDTSALMSGARINHQTLSLDNTLGGSFVVQRISTGQTYKVSLADKSFLKALKSKEEAIKAKQKQHQKVTAKEIDEVEALAFEAMRYMLQTDTKRLLKVTELKGYQYHFNIDGIGSRSDVKNKNVGR